jgi:hypothetical protein
VMVGVGGLGATADDWAMAFSSGTSGAAAVQAITSMTKMGKRTISPKGCELRAASHERLTRNLDPNHFPLFEAGSAIEQSF